MHQSPAKRLKSSVTEVMKSPAVEQPPPTESVEVSQKQPTKSRQGSGARDKRFQAHRGKRNEMTTFAADKALDELSDMLRDLRFSHELTTVARTFWSQTSQLSVLADYTIDYFYDNYQQLTRRTAVTQNDAKRYLNLYLSNILLCKTYSATKLAPIQENITNARISPLMSKIKEFLEPAFYLPSALDELISAYGAFERYDVKQWWIPQPAKGNAILANLEMPLYQAYTYYPTGAAEWRIPLANAAETRMARAVIPAYQRYGDARIHEGALIISQEPIDVCHYNWQRFTNALKGLCSQALVKRTYGDYDGNGAMLQLVGRDNVREEVFTTVESLTPVTIQLGGFAFRPTFQPTPVYAMYDERVRQAESYSDAAVMQQLCARMIRM